MDLGKEVRAIGDHWRDCTAMVAVRAKCGMGLRISGEALPTPSSSPRCRQERCRAILHGGQGSGCPVSEGQRGGQADHRGVRGSGFGGWEACRVLIRTIGNGPLLVYIQPYVRILSCSFRFYENISVLRSCWKLREHQKNIHISAEEQPMLRAEGIKPAKLKLTCTCCDKEFFRGHSGMLQVCFVLDLPPNTFSKSFIGSSELLF